MANCRLVAHVVSRSGKKFYVGDYVRIRYKADCFAIRVISALGKGVLFLDGSRCIRMEDVYDID